jgi:predicted AlkP superfamily pyrophosphatase or phosphodiesterase
MIHTDSIEKIGKQYCFKDWVYPDLNLYNFANINEFVLDLFSGRKNSPLKKNLPNLFPAKVKKVILILIDALGWNLFEKYKDEFPLFSRLVNDGMVLKMTSQFPSTTSAEITSILTGQKVGESGVYEWRYFEPLLDSIIKPLESKYNSTGKQITNQDIDPFLLYPSSDFAKQLLSSGIVPHAFNHRDYSESFFNKSVCSDFKVSSYKTVSEALLNLKNAVKDTDTGYFYAYFGDIDSISHKYGPFSGHTKEELRNLCSLIDRIILANFSELGSDTVLLLTADHGHAQVDPSKLIDLNVVYPQILHYLETNRVGELKVPAGSRRDFFLHIKQEFVDLVVSDLSSLFKGKARVYKVGELIAKGVFGKVEQRFRDRVGNVVILACGQYSVWWHEEGQDDHYKTDLGSHGGLSRDEMEIPFAIFPGSFDV